MQSPGTRTWVRSLVQWCFSRPRQFTRKPRALSRPQVETLEDRMVPTTWTVTNTLASGAGSLYQAVQNANSDTSPSIINFDPTVFAAPQTITLTSSLVLDNATEPVTIEGPTGAVVTISGNSQTQDFICSGVAATIQNLTISNGNADSNYGGGVNILGGTVTIDDCTISNSTANWGGGVSIGGTATALIESSTLSGNTAANYGGGIVLYGGNATMTLIDSTISGNTVSSGGQGGGGLYVGDNGNPLTAATVIDCTFAGNTATGTTNGGGGIGSAYGNLVIVGSTITGNSASAGGGIKCDYYYGMTLLNDVIWNNTAPGSPDLGNSTYDAPTINHTLVGNTTGSYIPAGGAGNILNVSTTPAILGALTNNGGPTQTCAPVAGSPPVDAGGSVATANAAISSSSITAISVANGRVFAASSLTQLSFVTQPNSTITGDPLNPVTLQAIDPVDFNEFIQIDGEQMQVVGLTTNANGSATLYVQRGVNGTTATIHAANAPIYLVSDQRGEAVSQGSPPPVDMGSVQSSANTTPTLASNPNLGVTLSMGISLGTLNGTTTAVTNASGQAVFNTLWVPTPGLYQLEAAGAANSSSFTISAGTYPVVTGISPTSGAAGRSVTITGTNFTGATGVSFGGTAASSFTINSATQITATAPTGSGIVDVQVTTPLGTSGISASDHFTYSPGVTSISPSSGNTSGGTSVTITGTDFTGATAVHFGSTAATSFTVNSFTQITAIDPAGSGVVNVTVTIPAGGTSANSSADQFTYVATPTVTGLSATTGATAGGASIVITGTAFTGATAVYFGGTAASSFTVNSATQITAIAPAEPLGTVDVTVTTYGGTSATSAADQFTFAPTANSIVVTTSSDAVSHTGVSLRDAIATANTDASLGFNDTITFALALNGTTISLLQGAMTMSGAGSGSETINGAGQITLDGGNSQRFLIVDAGVTAAVNGLVIQNMNYGLAAGVGILNSGTLTVTNSTFNHCSGNGGGALCDGTASAAGVQLMVIGCTFINNSCNGEGGGIGNNATGPATVTISDCSFSGNGSGAAVNGAGNTMTITNSTFVGNSNTFSNGGAISNAGTITISDCTISGNTGNADSGGGVGNSGTMVMLNTVVANNTASTDPDFATTTGTLTGSYDIIGNGTGMTGIANGVNNNQVGTGASPLVVPISTLGNYGGPLQTALLLNSTNPALNTGSAITTLQTAITSTSSSLTLAEGATIASTAGAQAVIQIDSEQILVSYVSGNNFNVITRGYNSTVATAHNAGAGVNYPQYETTETRLVAGQTDVGAAQDATVAFTTNPPATVSPNGTFTVALHAIDQENVNVANLPITLQLSSGTLSGTTSGTTNASGAVTCTGLSLAVPGTYTISAYVNNFLVATSNSFVVLSFAPTVTSVSPTSGSTSGGTSVIITGTNFTTASAVSFGATAATRFTVNSATQITASSPAESADTVNVIVTNNGGTSATSAADHFTYAVGPAVNGVTPNAGPIAGGTTVSIIGSGFTGASAVTFGNTAASSFVVSSATLITAVAPAEAANTVDVKDTVAGVTSATSSADQYTFAAVPTVTALSPNNGLTLGGTSVVITGTNFTNVSAVSFGGTAASSFTVNSTTQITAVSPAESFGIIHVIVTAAGGTSAAGTANQYTFVAGPAVSGVSPNAGPTSGGTSVTITGSGFSGATAVAFGSTAASSFVVNSATQITAVAPAEGAATVDVKVTASGFTSATSAADQYAFIATPVVSSLSSSIGAAAGGASIIITGSNFTGATAVSFGGTAASSFTVNSATQITAIAPPESIGTVDVTVTDDVVTSATSAADHFTYDATANSIVVTTNSDAATHTGVSLRDALTTANADTPLGFNDTITFAPALNGTTISWVQGVMTMSGAGPGSVTINGAGQITVDGGNSQRFLVVDAGVTAAVNGLVIQNMNYGLAAGVGILNSGTLTVTNSTFNHCSGNGGGALCDGTASAAGVQLTVIGCTFINNSCNGEGGGIGNNATGPATVTISDCSFSGNSSGAAVNGAGNTMTITNSTFVGNSITFGSGGAISNAGTITISDCTISGNTGIADSGGGVGNSGTMVMLNTVVANNTASTDPDFATTTGTLTGSYDVIGNGTGMTGLANGVNNNQVGTGASPLVVPISTLGNYGGPLQTALLLNSTNPALNTGSAITTLQTGITSTSNSLTLADGAALASTDGTQAVIQIDSEQILVSYVSGNNFNVITRGYNSTTAAPHNAGAGVNYPQYETTETRLVAGQTDVGAAQDATLIFTSVTATLLPNSTFAVGLSAIDQEGANVANLPITLQLSSGTLNGTTSGTTNASGAVTFTGLSIPTAGTYTIFAYVNNFLVATSNTFVVLPNPPTVASISPNNGPDAGGTPVIINGTNFTSVTTVSFGGTPATSFTVSSATQITAVSPAGSGIVDVTVTTTGGSSATSVADNFTYAPSVTSVSPNSGIANGGTSVIITGTNFTGATAVHFDGSAASFIVNSPTQITAVSPPGTAIVDVTVTIPIGGTSAASPADLFTYAIAPAVTNLSPNTGPAAGGTSVIITGTGFTAATAVNFGGTPATSFTVNSPTQIAAISPPGTGLADVTVVSAGGASATSSADQFAYLTATTISLTDNGPYPSTTSQAVSFTVAVSGGTPINGETVAVEDADNGNAVVATPTLTGSTVTFTIFNLSVGTHHLFAVYNGDATHIGSDNSASPVVQTVTATSVNLIFVRINSDTANAAIYDGGVQRSMVNSVVYYFDTPVNLDFGAITITLHSGVTVTLGNGTQTTGTAGTVPDGTTWSSPDGGFIWVVTFNGAGVLGGGSIADGVYDITLNAAHVTTASGGAVTLNSYNGGTGGVGNDTETFWCLFGDANKNQKVTTQDYCEFAQSYLARSNNAAYVPWFDQNGNNKVTTQDYDAFANNYLKRYSGFTATI